MRPRFFWIGQDMLTVLACLLILVLAVVLYQRFARKRRRRRGERTRVRQYVASLPPCTYEEGEEELLARLRITRKQGQRIAQEYALRNSHLPFRKPRFGGFPNVPLDDGDIEHLIQLYCR